MTESTTLISEVAMRRRRSHREDWNLASLATDPEILLRCAYTHAWEDIVLFCEFLALYAGSPQALKALQACDQYGNSVLMAACYYRPPERAVRAILGAANTLHCIEDLVHHRAFDGSTALQVACATGASVGVIEMLLTSCSTSGRLVAHADKQGSTPLSDLVVQYTLECKAPAHLRSAKPLEQIDHADAESSSLFRSFYSKLNLLILHSWKEHCAETQLPSILHGISAIAFSCPTLLTDMIIRCSRYKRYNDHVDNDGKLTPLRLALSSYAIYKGESKHCKLLRQQYHFVKELFNIYPQALNPAMLENQQSLLIHAISAGMPWDEYCMSVASNEDQSILQLLLDVAPSMMEHPDTCTGLLPWQLAAIESRKSTKGDHSVKHLNTIYNLLRLYPQSIKEKIESTVQRSASHCKEKR